MIYLENTTFAQAAFIPRNGDAPTGTITLTARSTVDLTTPLRVDVLDLKVSRLYFDVSFRLPAGMADGEYRYELAADGKVLSEGLMIVGVSPLGPVTGAREYVKETTYKQYNG